MYDVMWKGPVEKPGLFCKKRKKLYLRTINYIA